MLTTIDNPFDPWTQYEEWLAFDRSKGYNTNEILARHCLIIDDLPEEEQELEITLAIDSLLSSGYYPFHIKVDEGKFSFKKDNYKIVNDIVT